MILVERDTVRKLTKNSLKLQVIEIQRKKIIGSFIMSDLLGKDWSGEYEPFYKLYEKNNSIAGQEMGKLLAQVCRELKLKSQKELRFGKKDAITRYYL